MSSRRRADAPETSFSFQIPTTAWGDDFLLEDDSDFLKGADILATPAPSSRFALEPLTINDLTPRPPNAASSFKSSPKQIRSRSLVTDPQGSPPRPGSRKVRQPRPKPNSLRPLQDDATAIQSPAGEPIESHGAQVNFLTQDPNDVQEPPPSDSPKAPVPKRHSGHRREAPFQRKDPAKNTTVLNDGRMKGRQRRSTRLSSIAPIAATTQNEYRFKSQKVVSPTIQSTEIGQPAPPVRTISPDPSVGTRTADGMAGRSLMPSQNVLTDAHLAARSISSRPIVFKSDDDACQPVIDIGYFAEEAHKAATADIGPLTVSQLSPQKSTPRGLVSGSDDDEAPLQDTPIESLRSSSKRPASIEAFDENEGARVRKKGRPDPASARVDSPTPISSKHVPAPLLAKRRSSAPRKPIKRLSSGSRAKETLVGRTSISRGKAPLVVRPSRRKSGSGGTEKDQERESRSNETRNASKNSSDRKKNGTASNQSQNTSEPNRMRDLSHKMKSAVPPSSAAGASTSQHNPTTAEHAQTARSSSSSTSGFGAKSSSSKILHATIPIGFKFHSDARLEARKVGGSINPSESKKTNGVKDRTANSVRNDLREQRRRNLQNQVAQLKKARASRASEALAASGSGTSSLLSSSIPDFKAIHASQEAELTRQRDRLSRTRPLPVVPVTPRFVSDHRLKERHKFEERIKVKEKQLKEEREALTREKRLQEERELREVRKKAVPKAHDVPEWYKDAPKKAKLGESV